MKKIILIGGGGHCKSVIDVIERTKRFKIVGIIDKPERIGEYVLGYKIIGCDNDLEIIRKYIQYAFITVGQIGSGEIRAGLYNKLCSLGYTLPVVISPLAYVSKHAKIESGTIIMHHALVNANAKIGFNCIINSKALIEHDAVIGNHCHVATAAVVNGGVVIRDHTFFGSNATSKQMCIIEGFIKAGSIAK
ncbi:acetyltransferase [Gracilinema caldarium]|uniref:Sugar O-acyltransferase, sialic acid O-acetyltransferase NeuD family n=1 Tax=Gracilinema caldarium (strain ATCC 51460 / DSM 7334 / H1) TaxID=744872 RepID=F8F018_GRAC1|nr:acetyltransferase [Gracilinema caldarium]AEJ18671.1 sugar O-acyltransferase, sialic acid O-acetyltransferase NeuD family [Gracilinema caldarium DSM 7334]